MNRIHSKACTLRKATYHTLHGHNDSGTLCRQHTSITKPVQTVEGVISSFQLQHLSLLSGIVVALQTMTADIPFFLVID